MSRSMKLSAATLAILKNFSSINPSLLVNAGQSLSTISPQRNIIVMADVEETFPSFAIYDLNQFLGALSLFNAPNIKFGDKSLTISNDSSDTSGLNSIEYFYADPAILKDSSSIPTNIQSAVAALNFEINVKITRKQLDEVLRAASVLSLPEIQLCSAGNDVRLETNNSDVKNSNRAGIIINDANAAGHEFRSLFKQEAMKMLPLDYDLSLGVKNVARFVSSDEKIRIKYFVALESQSVFNPAANSAMNKAAA